MTVFKFLDNLFPIIIRRTTDVLLIEDRRLGNDLVLSLIGTVALLGFTGYFFRPLIESGAWWVIVIFGFPGLVLGVRLLFVVPIRETYVFDKGKDTYRLTHRSIFNSETVEGALSEIRGALIERYVNTSEGEQVNTYRVALLLGTGLMLGRTGDMILREKPPFNSSQSNESRIANAITDFLNLPGPEIVDM